MTVHLWPQNSGSYDLQQSDSFPKIKIQDYLQTYLFLVQVLNKPLVVGEFGLARDHGRYNINKTDVNQRVFYEMVFEILLKDPKIAGCNFWAWSAGAFSQ